jgi:hypothetical protein
MSNAENQAVRSFFEQQQQQRSGQPTVAELLPAPRRAGTVPVFIEEERRERRLTVGGGVRHRDALEDYNPQISQLQTSPKYWKIAVGCVFGVLCFACAASVATLIVASITLSRI